MAKIREKKSQCLRSEELLKDLMMQKLNGKKHSLQIQIERLQGLSPLMKLQQGYSYMVNKNNKNIRSVEQVKQQEVVQIYVTDGKILAKVEDIDTIEGYNK